MQILKEKQSLKEQIQAYKTNGLSVGFVPTMGALHHGHISLIQQALSACDKVVVSIFVNPTQFDNPEDLRKYPRNLEEDVSRIRDLSNEVIIFSPASHEVYGEKVISEEFQFDGLEHEMEGKYRKGHFNGVGTVVKKLLEMVQPDKAFFGEKDYQQLQIIKKLVEKHQINTEIIGCPIEREISGLARSSRNERLLPEQRQQASIIYKILQEVKESFGTKSASELRLWVTKRFKEEQTLELEYFEIANADTLKSVEEKKDGEKYRAFIAVYSGEIRLIDNIALN